MYSNKKENIIVIIVLVFDVAAVAIFLRLAVVFLQAGYSWNENLNNGSNLSVLQYRNKQHYNYNMNKAHKSAAIGNQT